MHSDRSEVNLMSRRTVMGAAAATMVSGASAESAERVKGPRVWLDLDQKELDDAYDQSIYAPNRDQMSKRRATNSELVRARLGEPRRVAYGPTPIEMLDIYATAQPNAPDRGVRTWRRLARQFRQGPAYGAETFVHAGAHFVVLDFINVIESGGDLMPMIDAVRRGVAWTAQERLKFRRRSRTAFTSSAIPPAPTSAAARSSPTGTRISACRPMT